MDNMGRIVRSRRGDLVLEIQKKNQMVLQTVYPTIGTLSISITATHSSTGRYGCGGYRCQYH
jgi:hypothetical protein